jgi:hypothetical protein
MLFSTARPKNIENADPYDTFKQWCLENGFSDVVHCKSKDVDLRRLNEAINQYMPANRKPQRTVSRQFSLFRKTNARS